VIRRLLLVLLLAPAPAWAAGIAAPTMAEMLKRASAAYGGITDYTCQMTRRERLGDGAIRDHSTVFFKFRKPGHYYMKWPGDWFELIYAEGRHDNKMVIHGGKLFRFASIKVDPALALKYNRHTIKEAGLGYVLDLILANYQKARDDREVNIAFESENRVGDRPTWRFKGIFPPGRGYYGHIVLLDFDQQLNLPVRIEVHGWQDEFLEAYSYSDLKLNAGLEEADFDIHNTRYHFNEGRQK
jgi:hypothetical protein